MCILNSGHINGYDSRVGFEPSARRALGEFESVLDTDHDSFGYCGLTNHGIWTSVYPAFEFATLNVHPLGAVGTTHDRDQSTRSGGWSMSGLDGSERRQPLKRFDEPSVGALAQALTSSVDSPEVTQ